MEDWDTRDYVAAFAVGTALGVAAALVLRPKRGRVRGIIRQARPLGERVMRGARRARGAVADGAAAGRDYSVDLSGTAREVLGEFRKELARNASATQKEVASAIDGQLRDARRRIRRRVKKLAG